MMRCFIAVDLDDNLKEKISDIQRSFVFPGIKTVTPDNLHFTLKFLGEIDSKLVNDVKYIMKDVVKTERIEVEIKGLGVFPNMNNVRVIWLGAPGLFNLQEMVETALQSHFSREKNITPHLTIARVKYMEPSAKTKLTEFRNISIGTIKINEIKLKKSILKPSGPVYEDIGIFSLD